MIKIRTVLSKILKFMALFFGVIAMCFLVLSRMITGTKWKEIEMKIDEFCEAIDKHRKG